MRFLPPSSNLRGDIDGLRALSILCVVAFHSGMPFVTGGFVGVDVFFVISGYLITGHLTKEWGIKGSIDLLSFWARRMRRLMPALLLVVFSTLIAAPIVLTRTSGEMGAVAKAALATLLMNSNHFFLLEAGNYFGASAETNPLLHMWSLSVEEQYYLIWPVIFWLLLSRIHNRAVWFGVLAIGCFCVSLVMSVVAPTAAFFTVPSRAWELLSGSFLAVLPVRRVVWSELATNLMALGGLILILASCIFLRGTNWFPAPFALAPVLGSMMIIAAGTMNPDGLTSRSLGKPLLSYLGRISYPWYLWHWPLLVFARSTRLYQDSAFIDALMICVSLVLAVLTYEFVEKPIQKRYLGRSDSRKTFAVGCGAIVVAVSMALLIGAWTRFGWGYSQKELALDAIRKDLPAENCLLSDAISMQSIRASECNIVAGSANVPRILLLGDSHANHWRPALASAVGAQDAALGVFTMRRCIPLPGSYKDPVCVSFNDNVRAYVRELADQHKIAGVIVSARWPEATGSVDPSIMGRAQDQQVWYSDPDAHSRPDKLNRLYRHLDDLFSEFRALGIRVLVVLPSPVLKFASAHCLAILHESDCGISLGETRSYVTDAEDVIASVAKKHSNVRVIDPKEFMCTGGFCPNIIDGVPVYSDDDHVTNSFSLASAGKFMADVAWLIDSMRAAAVQVTN